MEQVVAIIESVRPASLAAEMVVKMVSEAASEAAVEREQARLRKARQRERWRDIGVTSTVTSMGQSVTSPPLASPPDPVLFPDPIPSSSPEIPDLSKPKKRRVVNMMGEPEGFAEFWAPYWRKVSKVDAEDAWRKLNPDAELRARIIAAVTSQRPGMLAREPDRRPHAATWLNKRRWTDEVETPVTSRPSNGHSMARNFREEATDQAFGAYRVQLAKLKGG